MAQGQGAALGVEHLLVEAEQVRAGQHLSGEGLVELGRRQLLHRHALLRQQLPGGHGGADAQPRRVHPDRDRTAEGEPVPPAQSAGRGRVGDEHGGRAVGVPAGVPGRDRPAGREHGREACQQLGVQRPARAVVGPHLTTGSGDRHQLVLEGPHLRGGQRPPVAAQREGVLAFPADPVLAGDRLGGRTHVGITQVLRGELGAAVELDSPVLASSSAQRCGADALRPAGEEGPAGPGLGEPAGQHHRVQPRPALSVHGQARHGDRQSGLQGGEPSEITAGAHGVAHDHVGEPGGIQARVRQQGAEHRGQQPVDGHALEQGPGARQGRAPAQHQHGGLSRAVGHGRLLRGSSRGTPRG